MSKDIPRHVLEIALAWYRDHGFDPGDDYVGQLMNPGDDFYYDPDERGRSLWILSFRPPAYRNYNLPYTTMLIDAATLQVVKPRAGSG